MLKFIKRCYTIKSGSASLLKTLLYNFRLLPKEQAILLPISVGYKTKIKVGKNGKVNLCGEFNDENPKIYIGLKCLEWLPDATKTKIVINGTLNLYQSVCIGSGSCIEVANNSHLDLHRGFNITGKSIIICKKAIEFDEDTLISWDTLIMDSDAHTIIKKDCKINKDIGIKGGKHLWIGAKCSILSGTELADNTVIGCGAVVKGKYQENNTILVGSPARVIKNEINWLIDEPTIS